MNNLNSTKPSLLCLILLISFPSVVAILISPALPNIAVFFHISNSYVQQAITIYVLGYAFGQLIYSPLANRFGRKPAIYAGMSLYFVSSVVCLIAIYLHCFKLLLLARLFMALGASVGMVITYTIINDFYKPQQARSVVAYTVLAYAFMPAVAIAFGGAVTTYFSWVDCFYIYIIYGFVVFVVSSKLPETLVEKNKSALKIKNLISSYFTAFSSVRLILFSAIYGLMSAYIYLIASGGPFIGINEIGLSSSHYGLFLIIAYCGQFLGAIIAGRVSNYLSVYQVLVLGYCSVTLGSILMLIAFSLHWVNTVTLMLPLFFVMLGLPITYSSSTVLALLEYKDKATGSAVMSFITMGIALLATLIFTLFPISNPMIMPISFLCVLFLAVLLLWQGYRKFNLH